MAYALCNAEKMVALGRYRAVRTDKLSDRCAGPDGPADAAAHSEVLTGQWAGIYVYDDQKGPDTPFVADLVQSGTNVSGETQEDDFMLGDIRAIAKISGQLADRQLQFTKTYTVNSWELAKPITYAGTLAADGNSIKGGWSRPGLSGTFTMERCAEEQGAK